MDNNAVAYGSVYLDRGESWAKCKEQIDGIASKMKPSAFGFDIIGTKKQEKDAGFLKILIYEYAAKKFNLPLDHIYIEFVVASNAKEDPRDIPGNNSILEMIKNVNKKPLNNTIETGYTPRVPISDKAKKNNLTLISEFFETNDFSNLQYDGQISKEKMVLQLTEMSSFFKESKKFFLSVEKSQLFYDSFNPVTAKIRYNTFKLPFDTSTFIFEKPLQITWVDRTGKKDESTNIIGFICKFMQRSKVITDRPFDIYKMYLLIESTSEQEKTARIDSQYILFAFDTEGSEAKTPLLLHIQHYPCRDKNNCAIGEMGQGKTYKKRETVLTFKENINRRWVCQEILNRESLLETFWELLEKIHESEIIEVHRKTPFIFSNNQYHLPDNYVLPAKPDFMTKGNLPKPNYVEYIDGKRRKYDPEEIAYGTGTEHRYRYDVRRHPRIVNGKIVWIEPHQRGKGSYIPKVYANRKTWFVNYFWYQTEKLTKYRIFEILLIRFLQFIKKNK